MSEQKTTQQPEQELSEQRRVRREKLAALQAAGEDPFQQTRFDWTPPLHRSRSTLTRWRAGP